MADTRLILYHTQPVSARTRFVRFDHGGICGFEPLPARTHLDEDDPDIASKLVSHPAFLLRDAEKRLRLEAGALEVHAGFRATPMSPGGAIEVRLARFISLDPPFAEVAAVGGAFIALTEARELPPVELELLRRAYQRILG
ncbi:MULTISPECIES: hypothetical protein [Thiorhodovibrio]|uniref:hypothetical protein n=1 Tax=Thiorhodovibrio TaxID=61593 RepID=UPI0019121CD1|nr:MULTISPECIES: hypothetical protein [Thiorhodovibrio]MBK5970957.1 hypothetical protein [Thiorhodovibrio winogradskyi]WPL10677.1 hypothetical protein Thiosp_00394 [Thiorhodovibrio litoralis]